MGWLYMPRHSMGGHTTAKTYLDAQLTYEHSHDDGTTSGMKVLASSCPGNRVYYAAAQVQTNGVSGDVVAIVCLVRWNPRDKEGFVFGYKDMDETMGPCEDGCPEHILNLLTSTDHEYALDWRRRCLANLKRRSRKLNDGDRIRLHEPLKFTDGHLGEEFIVVKRGRRTLFRDPQSHACYRISRFKERAWSVVPTTKVPTTLFG
jgi:hypothetical protein